VNALSVFLAAFAVSALAGVAALLRTEKPLSVTRVLSAVLNSGMLGLTVALLWYIKFREEVFTLLGCCALAGLGGMSTVELAVKLLSRSTLGLNKEEKPDEKHD